MNNLKLLLNIKSKFLHYMRLHEVVLQVEHMEDFLDLVQELVYLRLDHFHHLL